MKIKHEMSKFKLELLNSLSHGIGVIIGIVFLLLLLIPSVAQKDTNKIVAFSIYASGFIFLFLSSTIYHSLSLTKAKEYLRILDHSAIFIFIACSYLPIILLVLKGNLRIIFLVIITILALAGVIYKIFSFRTYDKHKKFSTFLYILMGWIAIFLIKPIVENVSISFFTLILIGGVIYSLGTYFYKKKSTYSHFIWHIFVLIAAIVQFFAIYLFLL